jgi:hypothetical protein
MSIAKPLPPTPHPHAVQRSLSLDVGEASVASSADSSTPSIPTSSDGCQPPSEERFLQSSISLPNMPATVNVKFAPLPKIGPRDIRSTRPLGVAARSRMLQKKREIRMQGVQRGLDDRQMDFIPDEVQEEDPLEVLGRFIAAKSKSLWRRVSSKGKQSGKNETGDVVSTDGEEREPSRPPNREQLPSLADPPNDTRKFSKDKNGCTVEVPSSGSS